jgi:hydroxymethylglutaryl-CoA lyase
VDSAEHPRSGLKRLLEDLPRQVEVYEVGPRDGLQNEAKHVPSAEKIRLIESLTDAGLRRIEVTSFVSPKWIPQLADAEQVLQGLPRRAGVVYSALVPNLVGLERAKDAGLEEAAVFLSVTESHSKKNINKTVDEAVAVAKEVSAAATQSRMRVRGYVSCVWGCPYEGPVEVSQVVDLAKRLMDVGLYQLSLGDTIGVGTPAQTARILEALLKTLQPERLALHLHDTRGTALANALVGLHYGVTTLDASVGGLGGCPYAPGAAGNLATEDLVFMLQGLGVETGVNLERLVQAGELAQTAVGRKLPGKYLQAALGERAKQSHNRAQT